MTTPTEDTDQRLINIYDRICGVHTTVAYLHGYVEGTSRIIESRRHLSRRDRIISTILEGSLYLFVGLFGVAIGLLF
jgi:hypothetical protein